jgi:phosphate transport system substrate-binding protein
MERGIAAARMRPSVPIAATDQDNADLAEQIPGSLIGATYAQIFSEHRDLRFIAIGGRPPDIEAYESGRYPLGKRLAVITARQINRDAERFLEFLRSPAGVRAMRDSGIVACPA